MSSLLYHPTATLLDSRSVSVNVFSQTLTKASCQEKGCDQAGEYWQNLGLDMTYVWNGKLNLWVLVETNFLQFQCHLQMVAL